jgi:hypothetical protein
VRRLLAASPWLARAGLLRASSVLARRARNLPGTAGGEMRAFLNRPDHLTRASMEVAQWDRTVELADATTVTGVPVIAIDASGRDPLALLSDRGTAMTAAAAIRSALGR